MVVNSQDDFTFEHEIGARLRMARRDLSLNQKDMAQLGGVTLNTQSRYESGGLPSTEYLLRIGSAGADWYWVITGQRIGDALSAEESAFLDAFRQMDDVGRQAILMVAQRMANNTHTSSE